jgi:hypothetical protein
VTFSNTQGIRWNKSRAFKYEASWTKKKDHGAIIKQVWRVKQKVVDPWQAIHSKLQVCRQTLMQWVRKTENNVAMQIQDKI